MNPTTPPPPLADLYRFCPGMKIEPRPSPLGGNGLFLRTPHSTEEPLCVIPNERLITSTTLRDYFKHNNQVRLEKIDSPRLVMVVFFLYYRILARITETPTSSPELRTTATRLLSANPWTPYLRMLPLELDVPTFYDPGRLALLGGTVIPHLVANKVSHLSREYQTVRTALSPDLARWTCMADFTWCDAVYWSRVIETKRRSLLELAIIPILDFANHSFDHATVTWDRDEVSGHVHVSSLVPTLSDTSELFMCYDLDKSNEEFLFAHGFTVPGNDRGCVSLDVMARFSELAHLDTHLAHRLQWGIENLGLRPTLLVSITSAMADDGDLTDPLPVLKSILTPDSLLLILIISATDSLMEDAVRSSVSANGDLQPERVLDTLISIADTDMVNRAVDFFNDACLLIHNQINACPQEPALNTYCMLVKKVAMNLATRLALFKIK